MKLNNIAFLTENMLHTYLDSSYLNELVKAITQYVIMIK